MLSTLITFFVIVCVPFFLGYYIAVLVMILNDDEDINNEKDFIIWFPYGLLIKDFINFIKK